MPRPKPLLLLDAYAWQRKGNCHGLSTSLFYPDTTSGCEIAKQICAGCPVRAECLEFALATHEVYGVWGGCSERERRRIAKARRLAAA